MSESNQELFSRVIRCMDKKRQRLERKYYYYKYEHIIECLKYKINSIVNIVKHDGVDLPILIDETSKLIKINDIEEYTDINEYINNNHMQIVNIKSKLGQYKASLLQQYKIREKSTVQLRKRIEAYKEKFINELNEIITNFYDKSLDKDNIKWEDIILGKYEVDIIKLLERELISKSELIEQLNSLNTKIYDEFNDISINIYSQTNLKGIDIDSLNIEDFERRILDSTLNKTYNLNLKELVNKNQITKKLKINKFKENFIEVYDTELYELKVILSKQIFECLSKFETRCLDNINEKYIELHGAPETKDRQIEDLTSCEEILSINLYNISAKELIVNKIVI